MTIMSSRVQVPVADEHAGWVPDQQDDLVPQLVHVVVGQVLLIVQRWFRALG